VAFIEDDEAVGIPSDWTPSVPNLFDSGGDIDCSTHPSQQPSWGWSEFLLTPLITMEQALM